ncbi:MAG: cytochrome c [Rubrivivax sp.]|nr:cytochrome c [Rubrivivax sp.]
MKPLSLVALAAAALAAAQPAAAQFQKPEDAVKYRQSAMFLQAQTFSRVAAMANGRVPFDAKVAADNIDLVAALNRMQFTAFVDGTDKTGNTRAKPEIWAQKDKWNAAVAKSQEDVAKLVAAGKTGNIDQIKAAAGAVGGSCKSCHDDFRKE